MVSKACYLAAYRRKLSEMAALSRLDLTLVVPPYWRTGGRRALLEEGDTGPRERRAPPRRTTPDCRSPFEEGGADGYRMIVVNPTFNGHFHLHFYRRLPGLISRERPELVHIDEEPYDLVTFHALRAAFRRGARVIFFTWQNLSRGLPPPFSLMERYTLARAHGAIAGSAEAADRLRRKGYEAHLATIPQFGVDPEVFRPLQEAAPPRPFTVGYAGRLVREKGLLVLLDGLAGLDGDWRLVLVGDGPLRGELEEAAGRRGVRGRLDFKGGVPSGEMAARYGEMDVLALPSLTIPRWKEQFGRVLVEAMACGVPVVGSDSGEIPQVIGDAGLVCPEGDPASLRSALARFMESPGLRRELGRLGRERVLARYTHKRIAADTVDFYQRVMQ